MHVDEMFMKMGVHILCHNSTFLATPKVLLLGFFNYISPFSDFFYLYLGLLSFTPSADEGDKTWNPPFTTIAKTHTQLWPFAKRQAFGIPSGTRGGEAGNFTLH